MKKWNVAALLALVGMIAYWAGTAHVDSAYSQVEKSKTRAQYVTPDIDLETAQAVAQAAYDEAKRQGTRMDIAVVDAGGNLKCFMRMDGAWLGSIDIAIKKAKTARYFDMPTGAIGELSQPGGSLYNIEVSNGGLITFPGGLPLTNREGEVIGAIGVSGSSVTSDHACALAGAQVIK